MELGGRGGRPDGFVRGINHLAAYFNADDGLLEYTWDTRLQRAFKILTEIFDRVDFNTNVGEMVGVA